MSKALREIGIRRAARFGLGLGVDFVWRLMVAPPLRTAFLRVCGARIGRYTVLHSFRFINFYRGSFKRLRIGESCFIGDEVLIDLAAPITLEDQVTLAARATVLTHMNVGYADHPLQARFPSYAAPVHIGPGSFVGAGATILAGVTIGARVFVGAASLVAEDVPDDAVVGGVPARPLHGSAAVSGLRA